MPRIKIFPIFSTIGILVLFLIGCQSMQQGPEAVYMRYWEACNSGDMATAESLITEDAKKESSAELGACSYTHDFLVRMEEAFGYYHVQGFPSNSPVTEVVGNTAYLRFSDDEGSENTVTMYKIEGKWKIHDVRIFTKQGWE